MIIDVTKLNETNAVVIRDGEVVGIYDDASKAAAHAKSFLKHFPKRLHASQRAKTKCVWMPKAALVEELKVMRDRLMEEAGLKGRVKEWDEASVNGEIRPIIRMIKTA